MNLYERSLCILRTTRVTYTRPEVFTVVLVVFLVVTSYSLVGGYRRFG
jgi:hypothetical protein